MSIRWYLRTQELSFTPILLCTSKGLGVDWGCGAMRCPKRCIQHTCRSIIVHCRCRSRYFAASPNLAGRGRSRASNTKRERAEPCSNCDILFLSTGNHPEPNDGAHYYGTCSDRHTSAESGLRSCRQSRCANRDVLHFFRALSNPESITII